MQSGLVFIGPPGRLEILDINCTERPTPLLFLAKRRSTYSQANKGKFWGD